MERIARFIIKYKLIFFVVFAALIGYSIISIPKVQIENSITEYLPADTDTKQAIGIMDEEFVTYGAAKIMVRNITYENAQKLRDQIAAMEGVKSFPFENTEDYYRQSCALFNITFEGQSDDEASAEAYRQILGLLDEYDLAIPTPLVNNFSRQLARDMALILGLAALVILLVLLFTSKSFAEILAFPIIFGVAAVLNMGTNYWLGKISFVSNSVCIILQLALAIDYAIILCHRFTEEKEKNPGNAEEAMAAALSKAIPEIASSCLTTISGLLALVTMQLRLGEDLGIVLAKSIVCSILTVFFLMPGVLLTISKWMDKSRHRNFVPKISFWGKGVVKLRYVLPAVFLVLVGVFAGLQSRIYYVYSTDSISTNRPTATQVGKRETQEIFGHDNLFVILVPKGDYALERRLLDYVGSQPLIDSALGIANVEIKDGTYLVDSLNYRAFANLLDISNDQAKTVYRFYAVDKEEYWAVLPDNLDDYAIPLLDIMNFALDFVDEGYINVPADKKGDFDELRDTLKDAQDQLIGTNYTRLLFNIDAEMESEESFALIGKLQTEVKRMCPGAIFAGEAMSAYDLAHSFESDNLKISILTVLFIFVILMFTFQSWGIPIVLVAVIQGAIFINFGLVPLMGGNLFFFVYLIVSAIQMGATIDYAILITNRYQTLRKEFDRKTSVVGAINEAFPTIITSGCIMTFAAFLIGWIVTEPLIASIGMCLGRGTVISVLSVMTVLPALLYLLDRPLGKTKFKGSVFKKLKAELLPAGAAAAAGGEGAAAPNVSEISTPPVEKPDAPGMAGPPDEKLDAPGTSAPPEQPRMPADNRHSTTPHQGGQA